MSLKLLCASVLCACTAFGGLLDKAWIKGETDKDPVSYRAGEEMTFTLTAMDLDGAVPPGEYFLDWKRTDDFGTVEKGRIPLESMPFTYKARLDKAGFVRLEAYVVDKSGKHYTKKFLGDATTPEGQKAMNAFEHMKKAVFFDGGAGADVDTLASHPEPKDFDAFWAAQYKRLDLVPLKAERIEIPCGNKKAKLYAIEIRCAGLRPVTGYLSIPVAVADGKRFPARLETHGYSGDHCTHAAPGWAREHEIVLNINAHGLKLPAFGGDEA